jgi:hypothetical protein
VASENVPSTNDVTVAPSNDELIRQVRLGSASADAQRRLQLAAEQAAYADVREQMSTSTSLGEVFSSPERAMENLGVDFYNMGASLLGAEQVEKTRSRSAVGEFSDNVHEWATVFMPVSGWVGGLAKAKQVGSFATWAARSLGSGALADFVTQDGTASTWLTEGFDHPILDNVLTQALTVDEDDHLFTRKAKATLEGAGFGILADAFIGARSLFSKAKAEKNPAIRKDLISKAIERLKTVKRYPELKAQAKAAGLYADEEVDQGFALFLLWGESARKADGAAYTADEIFDKIEAFIQTDKSGFSKEQIQKFLGGDGAALNARTGPGRLLKQAEDAGIKARKEADAKNNPGLFDPQRPEEFNLAERPGGDSAGSGGMGLGGLGAVGGNGPIRPSPAPIPLDTPTPKPPAEPGIPLEGEIPLGAPPEQTIPFAKPQADDAIPVETGSKREAVEEVKLKEEDSIFPGQTLVGRTAALIGLAGENATFGTLVHELFHVGRGFFFGPGSEMDKLLRDAVGLVDGSLWDDVAEEKAVGLFLRWLHDGQIPVPSLQPHFTTMKTLIEGSYDALYQMAPDISPEVREGFEALIGIRPHIGIANVSDDVYQPAMSGALSSRVPAGAKASKSVINIGLDIGDKKGALSPEQVKEVLKRYGVKVAGFELKQSNTENTFVGTITGNLDQAKGDAISRELQQEAIAFRNAEGQGTLYGPSAEKWGPFNPDYFIEPTDQAMRGSTKLFTKADLPKEMQDLLGDKDLQPIASSEAFNELVEAFRNPEARGLPTARMLSAMAEIGISTKGQYAAFNAALTKLFDADVANAWARVNGAISANAAVPEHTAMSLAIVARWNALGRPSDETSIKTIIQHARDNFRWNPRLQKSGELGDPRKAAVILHDESSIPKVVSILADYKNADRNFAGTGRELGFGKTPEFSEALLNRLGVPIDTHMGKLIKVLIDSVEGKTPKKIRDSFMQRPPIYSAYKALVVKTAKKMGWSPQEVQEAVWSAVIGILKTAEKIGPDTNIKTILSKVTHDTIKQAWDAGAIFRAPEVQQYLKEFANVDSSLLDDLGTANVTADFGRTGPAVRSTGGVVRTAAERLVSGSRNSLVGGKLFPDIQTVLASRVPRDRVPAAVKQRASESLIAAVKSDRLKYDEALPHALRRVNFKRLGVGDDLKAGLQGLEEELGKTIDEQLPSKPQSLTKAEAKAIAELIGDDKALPHIQRLGQQVKNLGTRALVVRSLYLRMAEETMAALRAAADDPTLLGLYKKNLGKLAEATIWQQQVATEVGRALNSYNIAAVPVNADTQKMVSLLRGLSVADVSPIKQRQALLVLRAAENPQQFLKILNRMGDGFEKFKAGFWDVINEIRINAMLSGISTQVWNTASQAAMTVAQPVFQALGGRPRQALRAYANMLGVIGETLKMTEAGLRVNEQSAVSKAMKAFLTETPILDQASGTIEKFKVIKAETFGLTEGTLTANAVNWIGKYAVRIPSRFLTGADEFFKQINYRAYLRDEAIDEALARGLKDDEFAKFVDDYVASGFTAEGGAASTTALQMARKATFTQELESGLGKIVQNAVNEAPYLRLIMPFVRVPTNILKFVTSTVPVANYAFLSDFRKELFSHDPIIRADARGRAAFGAMFWTAMGAAAAAGTITGGGPQDPEVKAQKLATGWRPYSVKVGNEYIEYKRMEPFATIAGMAADFAEIAAEVDDDTADKTAIVMTGALMKGLTDKTYLRGLFDALKVPFDFQNQAPRYAGSMASSFIPNIIPQAVPDENLRDARTWLDYVRRKVPGYRADLPAKRNILGEKIVPTPGWPYEGAPLKVSSQNDSTVHRELDKLRYGFSPPPQRWYGIDLAEFKNSQGQDAYDRWQELTGSLKMGGVTLEGALARLVTSKRYKQLPEPSDEDTDQFNPRVKAVREIMGRYRQAALQQTLREYPKLKARKAETDRMRQTASRPVTKVEALQAILRK